jgi:sugar lactone lactonase YvrE
VAFDGAGNLVIADTLNSRIRVVAKASGTHFGVSMSAGNIYTVAGTTAGFSGDAAAATTAQLNGPNSIAVDNAGNLIIADTGNALIRMVPAVSGTHFGVAMTAGNIYTIAGSTEGYSGDGGSALAAQLYWPTRVVIDGSGNLVIVDASNARIRVVAASTGTHYGVAMTANYIYTVAGTWAGFSGDGGLATAAQFNTPSAMVVDSAGNLIVSDRYNHRVRMIAYTSGTNFGVPMIAGNIYTVAGTTAGLSGDGGSALAAQLNNPTGLALDSAGDLIIADTPNGRIRVVANTTGTHFGVPMTAGNIYTIAGTTNGLSGDGGAAIAAQLNWPMGVAVDSSGNLNIADFSNHRVRAVSP